MEIFRVKCGSYKEYVGDQLANTIDYLLLLFTKKLSNYTRKVKEVSKIEVDLVDFYGKSFLSEDLFFFYVSYFNIVLQKLLTSVSTQSKVEPAWADLISNMVNSLKHSDDDNVVSRCVAVTTTICNSNPVFCK